jgi:hypothetical protein
MSFTKEGPGLQMRRTPSETANPRSANADMGQHIRDLQKLSMLPLSVGNVGALQLMRN